MKNASHQNEKNKVDDLNGDELDLNKKPKKVLCETIDEILVGMSGDANGTSDPSIITLAGELKAMKVVIDATSGKPRTVDLERIMYVTYWKRLKEIQSVIKKSKKKK